MTEESRSVIETNMVTFDGPGSRPSAGDVDVVRIGEYTCPARVVSTEASIGPMRGVALVYVFRPVAADWSPEVDRGVLGVSHLLVPPVLVNKLPWTMKFFRRVSRLDFVGGKVLDQHCFKDTRGWFFDERSRRLEGSVEPVGEWGLQSYRTVDDRLSDALGIARV